VGVGDGGGGGEERIHQSVHEAWSETGMFCRLVHVSAQATPQHASSMERACCCRAVHATAQAFAMHGDMGTHTLMSAMVSLEPVLVSPSKELGMPLIMVSEKWFMRPSVNQARRYTPVNVEGLDSLSYTPPGLHTPTHTHRHRPQPNGRRVQGEVVGSCNKLPASARSGMATSGGAG
jgi:hypothetical protein